MTTMCLKQEDTNSIYTIASRIMKGSRSQISSRLLNAWNTFSRREFGNGGVSRGWEEGWLEKRSKFLLRWGDLMKEAILQGEELIQARCLEQR